MGTHRWATILYPCFQFSFSLNFPGSTRRLLDLFGTEGREPLPNRMDINEQSHIWTPFKGTRAELTFISENLETQPLAVD